jgi:hypothetical protein
MKSWNLDGNFLSSFGPCKLSLAGLHALGLARKYCSSVNTQKKCFTFKGVELRSLQILLKQLSAFACPTINYCGIICSANTYPVTYLFLGSTNPCRIAKSNIEHGTRKQRLDLYVNSERIQINLTPWRLSRSQRYLTTDGQSWCQVPHLGPKTRFLLLLDSCRFVVKRPLWWEDGSIVYNWCWPSPAQSFSSPSPARLQEYQESSWGVKAGSCLRLTTSSPYVTLFSWICGSLDVSQPYGPPLPVTGIALRFMLLGEWLRV